MAKQETMTLLEFQEKFNTEEACEAHLFQIRWPNGFICPKCGHNEYYNIKSRHLYQCKHCNHQASVTAGTIMEKTKTPLVVCLNKGQSNHVYHHPLKTLPKTTLAQNCL